jgi:hypothetical protein
VVSPLILAAGVFASAAAQVLLWSIFFGFANEVRDRVRSKVVARLIVVPAAVCILAAVLVLAVFAPMFLARFRAGVTTLEGLQAYTAVSCIVGLCVIFHVVRTPAAQRYARAGIWGAR